MLESHRQPLLPFRAFLRRMARSTLAFVVIVSVSLGIGTVGYHVLAELPWIDAVLNAAMILTGMGPVSPLYTAGAKLFAAGYALFSGIVFLVSVGVLITPVLHRLLHKFHLERDEGPSGRSGAGGAT